MSIAGMVFSDASTGAYSITTEDTSPHIVHRYFGAVGDINAGYRRLGLHFAGAHNSTSITDVCGNTITVNGDAKIDAVTTDPYGGTSGVLTCDGTGDYVSCASSADLVFGLSNLTIRGKYYFSGFATNHAFGTCLFDTRPISSVSEGFALFANSSGVLTTWDSNSTSHQSPGGSVAAGGWLDIEISRSGGLMKVFVEGDEVISYAHSIDYAPASTGVVIGTAVDYQDASANFKHNGKIKDFEIFIGKALHTSDFTTPSSTFIDYLIGAPTENAQIFDYVTPV